MRIELTEDAIRKAISVSNSQKELILNLGFKYNGGTKRTVVSKCREYGIDLSILFHVNSRAEYDRNPKVCKHCGRLISYEKRENDFCSHSCSAAYNNRRRVVNRTKKANEQNGECLMCGKKLTTRKQVRFCSSKCACAYQQDEYIRKWKSGEINGLRGEYGISNRIRSYLLLRANYQCEICGWHSVNKYTNTLPLEIHHKDGNYRNNTEDNLQVLCPNCHSLTETYKSHNKNGRNDRSKYLTQHKV